MKAFPQCIPCVIRQAIQVMDLIKIGEAKRRRVLSALMDELEGIDVSKFTPPEITSIAHNKLKELLGVEDYYKSVKRKYNKFALKLYPRLKKLIQKSADPLKTAVRLSIAGNVIDYGASSSFDIEGAIKDVFTKDFAIDHFIRFKKILEKSKAILYVGDNAGEIVFDKLLVEELSKVAPVTFAVKSAPILNDALIEDAKAVSMFKVARVIESGSKNAGTDYKETTAEFKNIFKRAGLVLAKGQGNLETLENRREIFYLLMVKCPHLAIPLGLRKNDIILASNKVWRRK